VTAAVHAARQLVWHLRSGERLPAPEWLSPAEAALFERMAPPDRLEGLAVAATLADWGWRDDRELQLAALLHDVGKCLAPSWVGYRIAVSALEAAPPLLRFAASRSTTIGALAAHAETGGRLAREAGLPEDVCRLIAGHHGRAMDDRMRALQRADSLH
jgi:putative nucleotidyltransferase with HDIG domain